MATIQTETAGVLRYSYVRGKQGRELLLRSSQRIAVPTIFPGCPAPAPGGGGGESTPGLGLDFARVIPADPTDPALAAAGFEQVVEGESWEFFPGRCGAGSDLIIPLNVDALPWAASGVKAFPMGLRLELGVRRAIFAGDDSTPPQSVFLGLADEAGDNVIAAGWMGSRETSGSPGVGVWIRSAGVDLLREVMRPALGVPTAGAADIDLTITRVGGGVAGRRAVLLWDSHSGTQDHASNIIDSMDPISPTSWAALGAQLVNGVMRPVVIITDRAGGALATDRFSFESYRIA